MKEEALLKIIESQQETIKELLRMLAEDNEREIKIIQIPVKDKDTSDDSFPPYPWQPYDPSKYWWGIDEPYTISFTGTFSDADAKTFREMMSAARE